MKRKKRSVCKYAFLKEKMTEREHSDSQIDGEMKNHDFFFFFFLQKPSRVRGAKGKDLHKGTNPRAHTLQLKHATPLRILSRDKPLPTPPKRKKRPNFLFSDTLFFSFSLLFKKSRARI